MSAVLTILRRCLLVPHVLPLAAVVALAAALAHWLAVRSLGAGPESLAHLRDGLMLLAALAHLGLCAPLELGAEARDGPLLLRRARGRGPGLLARAGALLLALLPACVLVALVTLGPPARPLHVLASLAAWVALGLLLGTWLAGGALRAALWTLALLSLARGLLLEEPVARWLAWVLPPVPVPGAPWAAALVWAAGALLLAEWRLGAGRAPRRGGTAG